MNSVNIRNGKKIDSNKDVKIRNNKIKKIKNQPQKTSKQAAQCTSNVSSSSFGSIADCGTPNCSLNIPVCCIIPIPEGFTVEDSPTVNSAVSTMCLECIEDICKTTACVVNPCGGNFECDVPIKMLRVCGALVLRASVNVQPLEGQIVETPQICCTTTVCVNNVVCVDCVDADLCSSYNTSGVVVNLTAIFESDSCNGHVLIQGDIILPPCPEPPPPAC